MKKITLRQIYVALITLSLASFTAHAAVITPGPAGSSDTSKPAPSIGHIVVRPASYLGDYFYMVWKEDGSDCCFESQNDGNAVKIPVKLATDNFVAIAGTGMGSNIHFQVTSAGAIVPESINPQSAAYVAADGSLTFRTAEVTVDAGDFRAGCFLGGFPEQPLAPSRKTYALVVGMSIALRFYGTGMLGTELMVSIDKNGKLSAVNYEGAVTLNHTAGPPEIYVETDKCVFGDTLHGTFSVNSGPNQEVHSFGKPFLAVKNYPLPITILTLEAVDKAAYFGLGFPRALPKQDGAILPRKNETQRSPKEMR